MKPTTHVTHAIEEHHFTPFASLLMHFPMAVNKVVRENQIYYEYKPQKRVLEATIFYRRVGGHNERIDIEFDRTAYSFGELEDMVRSEYAWADHFYNHRNVAHDECGDCTAQISAK